MVCSGTILFPGHHMGANYYYSKLLSSSL
jgi:hypothetical protein